MGWKKEEGNAWPVRSNYFTPVTKKVKERTVSSISALRLCTSQWQNGVWNPGQPGFEAQALHTILHCQPHSFLGVNIHCFSAEVSICSCEERSLLCCRGVHSLHQLLLFFHAIWILLETASIGQQRYLFQIQEDHSSVEMGRIGLSRSASPPGS